MNERIELDGWVLRVRRPETPVPHDLIVLLHGWTGDEDVMWIFASRLPQNAYLVAPRALYPTSLGGYGWQENPQNGWPNIFEFQPAIQKLWELLSPLHFPNVNLSAIRWMGFSQGAALVYSLALLYPERVRSLACLAGFMPAGAEELAQHQPLRGKAAFIAHGQRDEVVPLEQALRAKQILEKAGARVIYCVDDIGHKLSAGCFRGLGQFFAQH